VRKSRDAVTNAGVSHLKVELIGMGDERTNHMSVRGNSRSLGHLGRGCLAKAVKERLMGIPSLERGTVDHGSNSGGVPSEGAILGRCMFC
jgi:hypothetical protein